jgi:hypothetical protein
MKVSVIKKEETRFYKEKKNLALINKQAYLKIVFFYCWEEENRIYF